MTSEALVDYQVNGAVAIVKMNRPDALNAFNIPLREALLAALNEAEQDDRVKVVVLGSTGRAFSAGADLMESPENKPSVIETLLDGYRPLLEKISTMPLPVIGMAPGVAAGVGAAVLMACDLVLMAEEARIYMAFSHIGLVPDGGATWFLYQHLGYQRAFQLIVEGGSLDSQRCLALGIANQVLPVDQLEERALEWGGQLAQRSPLATAEAKRLLRAAATSSYAETYQQEAVAQHRCIASPESKAAVEAFKTKSKK